MLPYQLLDPVKPVMGVSLADDRKLQFLVVIKSSLRKRLAKIVVCKLVRIVPTSTAQIVENVLGYGRVPCRDVCTIA